MEEKNINKENKSQANKVLHVSGMYENWFLDYASSVILDRAFPEVKDGLKPVQRRILHSMNELEDGRYNKVANIIGNTMKYHPHGDASIGDALVQLGQKDLLIDTQGNWGNILTGDRAAAPRYIEARLTAFAKEVVFNPKTTDWTPSYDGRNKEPVTLPIKFPLLLAQGVGGIGVGLATLILPHNFNELIDCSISYLKKEEFQLFPDFTTGGKADFSKYNDGLQKGKVRIRANISKIDNKTLVITEIPFGTTTDNLIDSIVKANNDGKIKIKKIDDNTANSVEIVIQLANGISPDKTIDALYAFTDCELSISTNSCVIYNNKPAFLGVSEILKLSTDNTVEILYKELIIRKSELLELLLYASLERIFIENKIYRKIEDCKTWEDVISTIDKGLDPFKPTFYRIITTDDIIKLTELKIKKISKYDLNREEERARKMEAELHQVETDLGDIINYSIKYFSQIKEKFGAGKERKTEILNFDTIDATKVIASSCKLYFNRKEGFAGLSLKKDEYICDCSDIDDILTIHSSGIYEIRKVSDKFFTGTDIIHICVFRKNDDRTTYNVVYQDGKNGSYYIKRFIISGLTHDKEYDITQGKPGSKIIYLNSRPNGEAEIVKIVLRPRPHLKKSSFEFDFKEIAIKNKNARGNILTKSPIKNIIIKDEGVSTLAARHIWFDDAIRRLNGDSRGLYLGTFEADDKIFYATANGNCHVINFDLSNRFEDLPLVIMKHNPSKVYTIIYYSGEKEKYYVKRFQLDNNDLFASMLDGDSNSRLVNIFTDDHPRIALTYPDNGKTPCYYEMFELDCFIDSKSINAKGKRLTDKDFEEILILQPYYPNDNIEPNQEHSDNDESSTVDILPQDETSSDDHSDEKDESKAKSESENEINSTSRDIDDKPLSDEDVDNSGQISLF